MADYIKREDVSDALQNHYEVNNAKQNAVMDECVMIAMRVPVADVRENVHGKWLSFEKFDHSRIYECSVCEYAIDEYLVEDLEPFKFCPNCGADMRGERHD